MQPKNQTNPSAIFLSHYATHQPLPPGNPPPPLCLLLSSFGCLDAFSNISLSAVRAVLPGGQLTTWTISLSLMVAQPSFFFSFKDTAVRLASETLVLSVRPLFGSGSFMVLFLPCSLSHNVVTVHRIRISNFSPWCNLAKAPPTPHYFPCCLSPM